MTTDRQAVPAHRKSGLRLSGLLTFCAVLFVLQTGLVPFDFGDAAATPDSTRLFGASRTPFTFPDIISNLFLYVPIGVLFHWSWRGRVRSRIAAAALAVGSAAALSGCIEWIQAYSPARVSSVIDLVCNVLGAGVGVMVSSLCAWILPGLLETLRGEFHRRPRVMLAACYVFVLTGVAATPYSFSLDVNLFKRSLKHVSLVPFGTLQAARDDAREAIAADDYRAYSMARWRGLKCWSRWATEIVSFAVLAWLARPILRDEYRFSRAATITLIWWMCGGLAVAFSVIHLLLVTRGVDTTDLLFRLVGIAVGLSIGTRQASFADTLSRRAVAEKWRKVSAYGCAVALAYIIYSGVIPLTLELAESDPGRAVTSTSFLPFFAYFVTRFDVMMADVMEKFTSYGLFAALLVSCWPRARRMGLRSRILVAGSIGVAVSAPIELVQVYIPVRVASLTDLILAGAGCAFGVLVHHKAVAWSRNIDAPSHRVRGSSGRSGAAPGSLPPADALIASLADPCPDAPVESVKSPAPASESE